MKKSVILCDRCGKEIFDPTVKYSIFKRVFRWSSYRNGMIIERESYTYNYRTKTETLDLCEDCDKLFIGWIESGNNAKSDGVMICAKSEKK